MPQTLVRLPEAGGPPWAALPSKASAPAALRVLAVITGAWALPDYDTPVRYRYLAHQLQRYAAACDLGYDVSVVLATYEPWNHTGKVDLTQPLCARTMSSVPVRVALFKQEPIPSGCFGAAGTLAFQHRRIFLEERANFDLFLSQEDDIALEPYHLSYFVRWSSFFEGTDFYPGFAQFEVAPWNKRSPGGPPGSVAAVTSSHIMADCE